MPSDSTPCPRALFAPADKPLRFLVGSGLPFVPLGAGVELDSEPLSLTFGAWSMESSSANGTGDDAREGVDPSSSFVDTGSNCRNNFGDSLNVIIFVGFLFLSPRAIEAEGDRPFVLGVDTAIVLNDGVVCYGRDGGR
jgi:hypothetical protein